MLLVGQIRVSVTNSRTSVSRSRQNSSRTRPGGCLVLLRGPGLAGTWASPTRTAWRNELISGSRTSGAIAGWPASRAWLNAWMSPRSVRWACSGHTASGWAGRRR